MGLLDSMTPEDQGILQLGLGLLGSHGNFAQSISQGGEKGLAAYSVAKKEALDRQMQALQMQMALQKAAIFQDAYGSLGGNPQTTSASPPPASNIGPQFVGGINNSADPQKVVSQATQMTQTPQQQALSRVAQMSPDQIAKLKIAGIDLENVWKIAKEGFERKPGSFYEDTNGNRQYVNDPTKGYTLDANGNTTVSPGFLSSTAAITGANKAAETRAVNENTLADINRIDPSTNRPYAMTVAQMIDGMRPGAQNQPSSASPTQQGSSTGGSGGFSLPSLSRGSAGGSIAFRGPDEALQSAANIDYGKQSRVKAMESGQAYQNALNETVSNEFALVNRNKQIMPLLDRFNTGGLSAENRLQLGNDIKNTTWLPQSIRAMGDKIAGGDATAGKDLQNQLASAAITTMLDTLNKEGRPNKAIFEALAHAQEGIASGNTTLKDVFELQNRLYRLHYDEQQELKKAIKSGSYDPRTWQADYSNILHDSLDNPAAPLPSAGNIPFVDLSGKKRNG
jgi:hypothetical protein